MPGVQRLRADVAPRGFHGRRELRRALREEARLLPPRAGYVLGTGDVPKERIRIEVLHGALVHLVRDDSALVYRIVDADLRADQHGHALEVHTRRDRDVEGARNLRVWSVDLDLLRLPNHREQHRLIEAPGGHDHGAVTKRGEEGLVFRRVRVHELPEGIRTSGNVGELRGIVAGVLEDPAQELGSTGGRDQRTRAIRVHERVEGKVLERELRAVVHV